jgi:signal transduction histidine kinase/ActR/RegA family two-component response regulator
MEGVQWGRRRETRGMLLNLQTHDPAPAIQRLVYWSATLGVWRAVALGATLLMPSDAPWNSSWTYMTLVVVGLAAGAVATCGGEARIMRVWSWPTMGMLVAGWLWPLRWEGALVAVLVIYQHRTLVKHVALLGERGADVLHHALAAEAERDRVRAGHQELARMADHLRAERDRAEEADAAKTRVLATVSHDLRQPLFALSLNASALGDLASRSHDPILARIDQGMRRSLDQCRGLLDQMVDYSRLEAGIVKVQWAVVELLPYLRSLAPQYEAQARERGLAWSVQADPQAFAVFTDMLLLDRLLGNLIGNALKYTPAGEVGLRVRLGAEKGRIAIEVHDTGRGIPQGEHERVFEEFYQLDNPSRDRAKGLGLGLSIVRRLAGLLDARIELISSPGEGTRVIVDLPAGAARGTSARAVDQAEPTVGPARLHVLVIDDEPELLLGLTTMLGVKGWRVSTASDEAQALGLLQSDGRPDVLLADFRLGAGRTGLQAIAALQAAVGGPLPAVLVTGDTAPERIAEANAAGHPVLHKPLDGEEIDRALRRAAHQAPPAHQVH